MYAVNTAYRAGFILLADVFIYQFSNFCLLQAYGLDVVWSIIFNPKLELTDNLFYKDKKIYLYITQ